MGANYSRREYSDLVIGTANVHRGYSVDWDNTLTVPYNSAVRILMAYLFSSILRLRYAEKCPIVCTKLR